MNLDEHQRKAVEHFEGPALVVAGPGSGKTTVIIERILHLIQEHNIDPARILALAFNREVKLEIKQRLFHKLRGISPNYVLPDLHTLNAFGLLIVNNNYDRLKLIDKPIVWGSDPKRTIEQEIRELKKSAATTKVTIYIIQSELTGKRYIGQTIDPARRKKEHFSLEGSSNPALYGAMLIEGKEYFKFYEVDEVKGSEANKKESELIEDRNK